MCGLMNKRLRSRMNKNDPAPPSLTIKNAKFKGLCKVLSRKFNFPKNNYQIIRR
jgi:hypothetical protein